MNIAEGQPPRQHGFPAERLLGDRRGDAIVDLLLPP
jgi:hypothetical protein